MTTGREDEFHQAMVRIYERAREEIGYTATRFLQMVLREGGVATARKLLQSPLSDGFTTLYGKERLDLSMEAHVLLPRFEQLFNADQRDEARRRLEGCGFGIERWLRAQAVDDRGSGSDEYDE